MVLAGTTGAASTGAATTTYSVIKGKFTIAASQALEVQTKVTATNNTDGGGSAANFGAEIYTIAEFWKR